MSRDTKSVSGRFGDIKCDAFARQAYKSALEKKGLKQLRAECASVRVQATEERTHIPGTPKKPRPYRTNGKVYERPLYYGEFEVTVVCETRSQKDTIAIRIAEKCLTLTESSIVKNASAKTIEALATILEQLDCKNRIDHYESVRQTRFENPKDIRCTKK